MAESVFIHDIPQKSNQEGAMKGVMEGKLYFHWEASAGNAIREDHGNQFLAYPFICTPNKGVLLGQGYPSGIHANI